MQFTNHDVEALVRIQKELPDSGIVHHVVGKTLAFAPDQRKRRHSWRDFKNPVLAVEKYQRVLRVLQELVDEVSGFVFLNHRRGSAPRGRHCRLRPAVPRANQ